MMEQRSTEWHAERAGKINASEAGALLGLSPYRSAKAARKDWIARRNGKPDRDLSGIPDVQRGVELEPAILDRIEQELDTVIQQDGGRLFSDWMRASSDGFDDITVFEVKAPREFFDLTDRPDYALQLYLQMVAYGMKVGVFAQGVVVDGELEVRMDKYTRPELKDIIGMPDPVKVLKALWATLMSEDESEQTSAPDAFERLQESYLRVKHAADEARKRVDDCKTELLAACNSKPVVGTMLQVVEQTRTGSIDWKKLLKDHPDIDLDQYRADPTTYLTIREVK